MSNMHIIFIGENTKKGGRVNKILQDKGKKMRPVSRSTSPEFTQNELSTWPSVIQGARPTYITYKPDLAAP